MHLKLEHDAARMVLKKSKLFNNVTQVNFNQRAHAHEAAQFSLPRKNNKLRLVGTCQN